MESFLKKPIVIAIGWLGGIAGIISIPLSLYLASSSPELTYFYDKDSYFSVVNKGALSKLHVFHDDLNGEIKENLSIVKIKIWNAGRKVIRKEDIRQTIRIVPDSEVKILEAQVVDGNNEYLRKYRKKIRL